MISIQPTVEGETANSEGVGKVWKEIYPRHCWYSFLVGVHQATAVGAMVNGEAAAMANGEVVVKAKGEVAVKVRNRNIGRHWRG